MFCSNCGNSVTDGALFCSNCGERLAAAPIPEAKLAQADCAVQNQAVGEPEIIAQSAEMPAGEWQTPQPAAPAWQTNEQSYQASPLAVNQPEFPMKWFKFLIYFALFFAAILNFGSGIIYMTGGIYEMETAGSAEIVYSVYEGLQAVDMAYGLITVLIGVFSIVTRFRLAKFKKDGPACYLIILIANTIIAIIYPVIVFAITDISAFDGVYTCAMQGIMLGCNIVYFKKRKHLFVN